MNVLLEPNLGSIALKLITAACLGMLIGIERKSSHKEAGLRTFALIAMGCALFVAIGTDITPVIFPVSHFPGQSNTAVPIIASLVTGLGFLGAGIIIFHDEKVRGLTTAASVWTTAAIGATVGLGMYEIAIIATAVILFILVVGWQIEKHLLKLTEDDK